MGVISVTLPNDGETVDAADVNNPINTIVNEINGKIDNNNIKAGAGISTSKLTQDATAQFNPSIIDGASTLFFDHVMSGCVITGTGYGTTLAWSMTAGTIYIGGRKLTVASASGTVTASKDTYFDLLDPGTGTVATLVNTGGNIVANNAASPALAASSVRIGIVVSGANIAAATSINQGQETMVLPIASSIPYAVTDSLGNLICPRDPNRKLLGMRQILTSYTHTGDTTNTYIPGLSIPVANIPSGRKIKVSVISPELFGSVAADFVTLTLWEAALGSQALTTQLQKAQNDSNQVGVPVHSERVYTPTSSSLSINVAASVSNAGHTVTAFAASTTPTYAKVELE